MAAAAPGRFVLGIGTSSDVIVENWNGIAFADPYARVRDTVRFLRAALAGEKVTEEYETFSIRGFRLGVEVAEPVPIVIAALREGMLRLAGRFLLASYLDVPVYKAFHQWLGREDLLGEHWEQWASGDRKGALDKIAESVVDQLLVHGTPAECRARIAQYVANGVDCPALAVLPFGDVSVGEAVRALAPDT